MAGFEWDEQKREANIDRHGVDFRIAALIFENPVIEALDTREVYGEARYRTLGRTRDDEYFVVAFTWRNSNRRIISAWKVDEHGKKRYQEILVRRD